MALRAGGRQPLSIGKAAAYTLGIWDRLTRFIEDARIPLDNNATERAIRAPSSDARITTVRSLGAAQVAATLYTILETLKLHDVDRNRCVSPGLDGHV